METLVNIAQLIQNNFWVRGLYVIFCCVIIFLIVHSTVILSYFVLTRLVYDIIQGMVIVYLQDLSQDITNY